VGIVALTAIRPLLIRRPEPPPVGWTIPSFSLTDQGGRPFGSTELAGRVYVASFFFTSCPSVCPRLMQAMRRLQDRYAEHGLGAIRLVSISVDPERDTPERLREYADALGVDPTRWRLLTGDRATIRELLERGFKVSMGDPSSPAGGPYDIAHSTKLVLVDPRGGHRGFYDYDELGLDEVFHRSQHVLRESASRR
jgi:protein SCO1/2